MQFTLPTDDQIRALDDQLANEGRPAQTRPDAAMWRWFKHIGEMPSDLAAISQWFIRKFALLHPSVNFQHRPFAFLCVSARGIAYELNPSVILGRQVTIDPVRCVRIHQTELARIYRGHPKDFWEMYFQAADGVDLFLGVIDLHPKQAEAEKMLSVGTDQLAGSARQLVACANDSSLSQATCLAVEMVLKAVLHENGVSLERLKQIGHKIPDLCAEVAGRLSGPNDQEFAAVANTMPSYVTVRYRPPALDMNEAQDIYRRALFLCAEGLRRTRSDQIYYKMIADSTIPSREWK
jgi:hypothetical protein